MPQLHFNDEITPLVAENEDGSKVYRFSSTGIGCHKLGCGMKITVKDGKMVKVEGDEKNPITQGRLCVRCLTALEYVYHPDRLMYPMKRDRKYRGLDKWERISWDEAYDMIVENYFKTVEQYGVQTVSVWNGTGRENSCYHFTFANDVFGTPTAVHPNSGWSCLVPRMAAMLWTMGSSYIEADNAIGFPDRYDDPRWECPKYMVVWGRDPLRSNADGLFGHSIIDMMKRGMKLIVVDPRANWLATHAEIHLQLRPGTDAALALAMLNVVINEDLYDHEFVEAWTYGFAELKERVQQYPPEWAAEVCELDVDDIYAAARAVVAKPSTLSMGLAVDQNPNTMQIGHALLSLFAICGHMDVPGGCFMGLPPTFAGMAENSPVASEAGEPEGLEKYGMLGVEPLGHDRFPAMSAIVNTTHPDCTLDALEQGRGHEIHFAYVLGHNSIANMVAQPKRYAQGLQNVDFVAIADLFMTPMIMNCADVVLPVCTAFEHDNFITNSNASQPGQCNAMTHVIEPMGECKSDLEIMVEIRRRIYPNSTKPQWESVEAYLNDDLGKVSGISTNMDELRSHVYGQYEIEYKKYEKGMLRGDKQPGFNTRTGRIELWSTMLQSLGDDPLPYYIEPKFGPVERPDLTKEYPLILTTGGRQYTSFHSENRQIKTLREIHKWPTMQINPETARELGVVTGSWVWVENFLGRTRMCAEITNAVKESVVHCDHGWWLPETDSEELYGAFTYNINNLVPHEQNGPLGFGTLYKSMPCKVYLDDNQMAPSCM